MTHDLEPTRRTVLRGAGATAAGLTLAACGGSSAGGSAGSGSTATSGSGGGSGGGGALAKTSDIPVGGGAVFAAQNVVVTQPTAGTFEGFTATCTHAGCKVDGVVGGKITCPCHGSSYSITDGSVQGGPAPRPLPKVAIKVEGDSIVKA